MAGFLSGIDLEFIKTASFIKPEAQFSYNQNKKPQITAQTKQV
jgi:hypothetical protein